MGSFRKRLLVLIIGLVIVTQTVTLAAVLVSTRRTVEARAALELRSGGTLAEHLIDFRAVQLAIGVGVLAADFGFREAVASGHVPTILSAARNNAQRIGADVMLVLDTHGRVLASTVPADSAAAALPDLLEEGAGARDEPNFRVFGAHAYQLFIAPVRTPETIAWVAMGFVVDDSLAKRIRDLVGSQVAIVTHGSGGLTRVAATPGAAAAGSAALLTVPQASDTPHIAHLAASDYLSFTRRLPGRGDSVDVILLKPLQEVLAPYLELRKAMLEIDGVALLVAAVIGALLGRSASRPIGELVRAAQRIQRGHYETTVDVSGGDEFRSLAATFNAMQSNIAAREADITYHAQHDPLTQLPNRALLKERLDSLISAARTEPDSSAALLLVDISNLRDINASLGLQVGDEVLREAARRLQQAVAAEHTLARLGETQFLVLVLHGRACAAVRRAARRGDPQWLPPGGREPGSASGVRGMPVPGSRGQQRRAVAARAGGARGRARDTRRRGHVPPGSRRAASAPAGAHHGSAPRHRSGPAEPGVSAQGRDGHPLGAQPRGAGALAAPAARRRFPGGVRAAGRAHRRLARAHQLGAGRRHTPDG